MISVVPNVVLSHIIKRSAANKFVLILNKTNARNFITKNSSHSTLQIGYKKNYIEEAENTFLGLQIDNHINWKNHIEEMIPKLSKACYTIRLMVHICNTNTLKSI